MCMFRSLPFNILANLLSSGFYQMQNVFTNTIYAYIQFGVIQTSALGCFFSTLFLSFCLSRLPPFQCIFIIDFVCIFRGSISAAVHGYMVFFPFAPLVRLFVSIFVLLLYACLIQLRNDLNTFIHSLMTIFDDLK